MALPPTGQMLERESSREKNLEKNAKEAKAKARKEAAKTAEPLDHTTEEDLVQVGRGAEKHGSGTPWLCMGGGALAVVERNGVGGPAAGSVGRSC